MDYSSIPESAMPSSSVVQVWLAWTGSAVVSVPVITSSPACKGAAQGCFERTASKCAIAAKGLPRTLDPCPARARCRRTTAQPGSSPDRRPVSPRAVPPPEAPRQGGSDVAPSRLWYPRRETSNLENGLHDLDPIGEPIDASENLESATTRRRGRPEMHDDLGFDLGFSEPSQAAPAARAWETCYRRIVNIRPNGFAHAVQGATALARHPLWIPARSQSSPIPDGPWRTPPTAGRAACSQAAWVRHWPRQCREPS